MMGIKKIKCYFFLIFSFFLGFFSSFSVIFSQLSFLFPQIVLLESLSLYLFSFFDSLFSFFGKSSKERLSITPSINKQQINRGIRMWKDFEFDNSRVTINNPRRKNWNWRKIVIVFDITHNVFIIYVYLPFFTFMILSSTKSKNSFCL